METLIRHVVVLALAYLLGAIPTGYLVVRAFTGGDVRRVGSGRTGGTNVLRAAGALAAALTIIGDAAKAVLAVLLARMISGTPLSIAITGVAAFLGHNHSVFLGWRGGAGTIVTISVAVAIHPLLGAAVIVMGALVLVLSRYASLASISVAIALPALFGAGVLWGGLPPVYVLYAAITGLLSIVELRTNICRLLAGTERKVGQPSH